MSMFARLTPTALWDLGTIANTFVSGAPDALAVSGGYLYVADADNPTVYNCPINGLDGSLGACISSPIGTVDTVDGIAVTATNAYIVDVQRG